MRVIKEKIKNSSHYYEICITDSKNRNCSVERVSFPLQQYEKNGFMYYLIYDAQYQVLRDAFKFLNNKYENFGTRRQAAYALRILFSFEKIIDKKIFDFDMEEITNFKRFLHGVSYGGEAEQYNLITRRDNQTINAYLGIYRKYIRILGKENRLLDMHLSRLPYLTENEQRHTRYLISDKAKVEREVPRYISSENFGTILNIIKEKYTKREEVVTLNLSRGKARAGTVIMTRINFMSSELSFCGDNLGDEGRTITYDMGTFFLVNAYAPASTTRTRIRAKQEWFEAFTKYVVDLDKRKPVIICGDFNATASEKLDVSSEKLCETAGCMRFERKLMAEFAESGFTDVYRNEYSNGKEFTWHPLASDDERYGMRLDYFWVSNRLKTFVEDIIVFHNIRSSDHEPILLKCGDKLINFVLGKI